MASAGRPELPDGEDSGAFIKSFGLQIKLLRERAGLTQAELGSRVGYGADQIAAVEQGRRIPKPELIDKADEVLSAGGLLKAMKGEVARARYPAFFRNTARLEAQAVELHVYATQAVPGLLQTEEYARAVCTMWRPLLDDETIEQRVASRMARQEIFSRMPAPLMSFVIEEVVFQRPFGGTSVLRGQLEQILLIGQKRNVVVQVMPTGREEHAGLAGPFTLMETGTGQRTAYAEVQSTSRLHTERSAVRELEATYGIIRAQALAPRESLTMIEKLLGEL
ncbi:helix-turn-helix domain-containing protein [Streptomyces antimycoticus]|uniref:helix-turn-helix domain-containing protein n=1 Tax=Streptomyces antimycoticus TaxID=68175 RepID=UPI0036BED645